MGWQRGRQSPQACYQIQYPESLEVIKPTSKTELVPPLPLTLRTVPTQGKLSKIESLCISRNRTLTSIQKNVLQWQECQNISQCNSYDAFYQNSSGEVTMSHILPTNTPFVGLPSFLFFSSLFPYQCFLYFPNKSLILKSLMGICCCPLYLFILSILIYLYEILYNKF